MRLFWLSALLWHVHMDREEANRCGGCTSLSLIPLSVQVIEISSHDYFAVRIPSSFSYDIPFRGLKRGASTSACRLKWRNSLDARHAAQKLPKRPLFCHLSDHLSGVATLPRSCSRRRRSIRRARRRATLKVGRGLGIPQFALVRRERSQVPSINQRAMEEISAHPPSSQRISAREGQGQEANLCVESARSSSFFCCTPILPPSRVMWMFFFSRCFWPRSASSFV